MASWKHNQIGSSDFIFAKIDCMGVSIIVTELPTVSSLPLHLQVYDFLNVTALVTFGPASYSMAPIRNRGLSVTMFDYSSSTALTHSALAEWQSFMQRKILDAHSSPRRELICILDDTAGVKTIILFSLLMYHWGCSLEHALQRGREYLPRVVLTSEEEIFLCKQILATKQISRTKRFLFLFRRYVLQLRLCKRCKEHSATLL